MVDTLAVGGVDEMGTAAGIGVVWLAGIVALGTGKVITGRAADNMADADIIAGCLGGIVPCLAIGTFNAACFRIVLLALIGLGAFVIVAVILGAAAALTELLANAGVVAGAAVQLGAGQINAFHDIIGAAVGISFVALINTSFFRASNGLGIGGFIKITVIITITAVQFIRCNINTLFTFIDRTLHLIAAGTI